MNSFVFNDAIRFKLATQQEDTSAKWQVFIGVFVGVLLRWGYSLSVGGIKHNCPWCFWSSLNIAIRLGICLGNNFFGFSGYLPNVKGQPPRMQVWNAVAYRTS